MLIILFHYRNGGHIKPFDLNIYCGKSNFIMIYKKKKKQFLNETLPNISCSHIWLFEIL